MNLFDELTLPTGRKGVVIHVYEGVLPPTFIVETFPEGDESRGSWLTLQRGADGSLIKICASEAKIQSKPMQD